MHEENAALLRRAWAAYDRGDEEEFAACLTDDWCEHTPSERSGRSPTSARRWRRTGSRSPTNTQRSCSLVAEGDMVACHCTTSAVHRGPYFDLAPTGTRVSVDEMMFNRIEGGRVAETWVITAGPGFYRQLTGREVPEDLDNMG